MRDIGLARRQFFGALGLLLCAGLMAQFALKPQYALYQANKQTQTDNTPIKLAVLQSLPVLSAANLNTWQKNVVDPIYQQSLQSKTIVISLQADPRTSYSLQALPAPAKRIPITLIANGSFSALQAFVLKLTQQFPYAPLHLVELKSIGAATTAPEDSPVLEGTIQLDMLVLYQ